MQEGFSAREDDVLGRAADDPQDLLRLLAWEQSVPHVSVPGEPEILAVGAVEVAVARDVVRGDEGLQRAIVGEAGSDSVPEESPYRRKPCRAHRTTRSRHLGPDLTRRHCLPDLVT